MNETFTSGDKFSNVEQASALTFPDELPQVRSIEGAATEAQTSADAAASTASNARAIAIGSLALAVIASGAALRATMRR